MQKDCFYSKKKKCSTDWGRNVPIARVTWCIFYSNRAVIPIIGAVLRPNGVYSSCGGNTSSYKQQISAMSQQINEYKEVHSHNIVNANSCCSNRFFFCLMLLPLCFSISVSVSPCLCKPPALRANMNHFWLVCCVTSLPAWVQENMYCSYNKELQWNLAWFENVFSVITVGNCE